jgi:predicted phosphodiesterase
MQAHWTEKEDKLLRENLGQMTYRELAQLLHRSYSSVGKRIERLGLTNSIPKEEKVQPIKHKDIGKFLVEQIREEMTDVKPIKSATQSKTDRKGDTLVIHLTDLHAGKIVKNQEGIVVYNEEVFKHRVERLCEQTLKLLDNNIKKGVPITDVVILSTGDLANGEGIYATQAYEQELAPPRQVMLCVDVISRLIKSLLDRNLSVSFFGVRGNHGRTAKDTDVASNWDLMCYMILDFWAKMILKNPKLTIKYTETEHLVLDIRGHGYLIRHIAPEQVDSPAGRVKINEWARIHKVESVVYGHYHHAGIVDCDNVRVFRGGSIVGGDSLSESMAKHSEPLQLVWGVNEARVSTFIYLVDLGDKK